MQPWTIGDVLGRMLDTFARHPLGVIFALGLLPAAWMVPADLLQSALIPADAPIFGPGRTFRQIAISLTVSAWSCFWFAGQISAAVALSRGDDIRWRAFVAGVRKAPALFVAGMITLSPLELLDALPLAPDGVLARAAIVAASSVSVFLLVRAVLWAPLIAESSLPFWAGLTRSWAATRGHFFKLMALGLILVSLALPLLVIEAVLFAHVYASVGLISTLCLLALGQLYPLTDVPHADSVAHRPVREG